jgi:hypothetical protein
LSEISRKKLLINVNNLTRILLIENIFHITKYSYLPNFKTAASAASRFALENLKPFKEHAC